MEEQEKVKRRTRDGCWTCRKRKKKCDGTGIPCGNCTRLGLECENQVRLVWEDDARRAGMKRRGPAGRVQNGSPKKAQNDFFVTRARSGSSHQAGTAKAIASQTMAKQRPNDLLSNLDVAPALAHVARYQQLSAYPRALDANESLLLDHYIQRFSREYPTCSGPSNPFLSVLIPIAMKCSMVLDSLLALSGAQRWEHGPAAIEKESLRLRQQALKGARKLLLVEDGNSHDRLSDGSTNNNNSVLSNAQEQRLDPTSQENLLCLLTSSILFLLYEKVSGETTWKPHMEFISQFFERWMTSLSIDPNQSPEVAEAIRFLHDLFVYNDLVRATTLKTKPLSNFYLTTTTATGANCSPLETAFFPSKTHERADFQRRYYFPNIIARLSSGDHSVSEEDIAAWDGSMDWLPSFALDQSVEEITAGKAASSERMIPWNDKTIISELYRTSATIYRRQILRSRQRDDQVYGITELADNETVLPQLASFAHFLLSSLPEDSPYENALIWPIGISAKELTMNQVEERSSVLQCLQRRQGRVNLKYYQKVQEVLLRHWAQRDSGMWTPSWLDNEDAILLG